MNLQFRIANAHDFNSIWEIIEQAIARRKADGSSQWQDGYPNRDTIKIDIQQSSGFVITNGIEIIAYAAVILNDEPAYEDINGTWLSESDFYVVHRVAVAENYLGKGYVQELFKYIENYAWQHHVYSIKVDTNFDNPAMIKVFEKLGYQYCGEVKIRGNARKAFEKLL